MQTFSYFNFTDRTVKCMVQSIHKSKESIYTTEFEFGLKLLHQERKQLV